MFGFDPPDRILKAGDLDQRPPLTPGHRHDHHPVTVLRGEIPAECSIQVISGTASFLPIDLKLPDETQMAHGGEGDVGERELDQLPLSGFPTVTLGGRRPVAAVSPVMRSHAGRT